MDSQPVSWLLVLLRCMRGLIDTKQLIELVVPYLHIDFFSALPPALQLTHYDADVPSHGPPSPAYSHGPPGSENGDSPVLSRKPFGTAHLDDRQSVEVKSVQRKGSDADDHDYRRSYHNAGDSSVSSYPHRSSYEPEPDYSVSRPGRKPNAGGWLDFFIFFVSRRSSVGF